jgi:probable selenium-dependent hydroxylase accessory protein YqeC
MTLREAFSLKDREVISLVGAGGKTTLHFALGNELSSYRKGILLTTTTKIWEPAAYPSLALFLSDQLSQMKKWAAENLDRYPYLLIARERLKNSKLQGIVPQWIEELHSLPGVSVVIVEADGAAGRSLKAPREGEPVVPQNTSLLIPVVGIDVLGCPLDEQHVFRSEIAARVLNMATGSTVTEEMIARLLEEIIKNRPEEARVIPFINKVDLPGRLEKARNLAQYLLSIDRLKMERVILGQVQCSPAVKEVILC